MASFIIVLTSESFCLYALDRLSPFCNWRVLLLDSKFQAMIEALSLTPRCRCKKPLSAVLTSEARWRRCVRRCPHKSRSMSYRHYYRTAVGTYGTVCNTKQACLWRKYACVMLGGCPKHTRQTQSKTQDFLFMPKKRLGYRTRTRLSTPSC